MGDLLSAGQVRVLARACELLVPGSAGIGPVDYIRRRIPGMPVAEEDALHAAVGQLAGVTDAAGLAALAGGSAFELVRRLAIEAYYGDFVAEGSAGVSGHRAIGFETPHTRWLRKDWGFLGEVAPGPGEFDEWDREVPAAAEVVVVGSGAGGGVIAADLAARGVNVLLLEAGGFHPAAAHTRFELRARHDLWWPVRVAGTSPDGRDPVALISGRCVGGSTVTNTKVAMRASAEDFDRFRRETGLDIDLGPYYDRLEAVLGVRERSDWLPNVHLLNKGFAALGAPLEPVRSYTDHNCSRCGSCIQGCPTNAGKSTLNTFLTPVLREGKLRMRTRCLVERVVLDGRRVRGVAYRRADGSAGVVRAPVVVLAAGALRTPQILLRSNDFMALDTPSTRLAGRTLGLHPARLVYGRFADPQDCHRVYPITAHHVAADFVIEASTIQDPVSFADSLVDKDNRPMWGDALVRTVADYRCWAGMLVMARDENTGQIDLTAAEDIVVRKRFRPPEAERLDNGLEFAEAALFAAGAKEIVHTGLSTTHMQGSARMGADPSRSVVDERGQSHDVAGLYVGDGSLIPAVLSANPSLTIMALAAMVAEHLRVPAPALGGSR